jgi:ATP-dependent Lon protease
MERDADGPTAALAALPVFPLPQVTLFPRAVLPLHIFEPRYRAMLADAMASHRCMALTTIVSDDQPPGIARVAGVGVVARHEELPDGRSYILLRGLARVELDELPFVAPYRRARARVLLEQPTAVTDVERAALRAAAAGFVSEVRRRDLEVELELPEGLDVGAVADLCAAHIVLDAAVRQQALEELDVAERVRLVTGELVSQTARLTSARGGMN